VTILYVTKSVTPCNSTCGESLWSADRVFDRARLTPNSHGCYQSRNQWKQEPNRAGMTLNCHVEKDSTSDGDSNVAPALANRRTKCCNSPSSPHSA